jgi:predicted RNA binding protein YcfA (HicA-like mRNA interferase family)
MPKNISWRKLVQNFKDLGFSGPYAGGRHLFMIRGGFKLRIPNPHKKDISKHLISEILRQAKVSTKEWNELIKK